MCGVEVPDEDVSCFRFGPLVIDPIAQVAIALESCRRTLAFDLDGASELRNGQMLRPFRSD